MGQQGDKNRFDSSFVHTQCEWYTSIFQETASGTHCISMDGVSSATIADNVARWTLLLYWL